MPGDAITEYIEDVLKKLARRKSYKRKKWGPTNDQLKTIIDTLVKNDTPLIKTFFIHAIDLLEVSAATFWGNRRKNQIEEKATELRTLKDAENKSRERARHGPEHYFEGALSPRDLKRFMTGFSRRQDIASRKKQLASLITYHPNFPANKRQNSTGRRQDLPVKIMRLELELFFDRKHSDIDAALRRDWVRRIVNASQEYHYSKKTFQKQTARLRQQRSFLSS